MKDNARFDAEKSKTVRKVATASFFCNFIEWFDYATYSYFAVVIAQVFFPNDDPALALIQTFAVFALSFLLRPIGAIFWGNMGDKKGRKWSLTVSVFMMAGATFCIGLLPGYAALGICAPALLLLLRMIQGFSASGEYAGAQRSWPSMRLRTSAVCIALSFPLPRLSACWLAALLRPSCTPSCRKLR